MTVSGQSHHLPCKWLNLKKRGMTFIFTIVLVAACYIAAFPTTNVNGAGKEELPTIHISLSKSTIREINRNDAQAAIMAWAKIILKQRGIDVDVKTELIETPKEIVRMLKNGKTDAVAMSTDEFIDMKEKPDVVYISSRKDSLTEKYILVVNQNDNIHSVEDLRGHKLLMFTGSKMSLARYWIKGLINTGQTGSFDNFFKSINPIDNISRTVLPVFFRQADAGLITLNAFEVAGELNPQLQKELRVLAMSPEIVTSVFFFRPEYTSDIREKLDNALLTLHETASGRQVLMIFQGDGMKKQPISFLENSRLLVEAADHRTGTGK
jgi:ABC-type phosphate/phosphonate transport system substrate-binding protein